MTFATHFLEGTHAARPVATDVRAGTLYRETDTSLIAQSDGATWSTYAFVVPAGGTTGQELKKTSGSDGIVAWA